jgi:hypothetical protein
VESGSDLGTPSHSRSCRGSPQALTPSNQSAITSSMYLTRRSHLSRTPYSRNLRRNTPRDSGEAGQEVASPWGQAAGRHLLRELACTAYLCAWISDACKQDIPHP